MAALRTILYLVVYPGLVFLFAYSTFCEWSDRKVYARLQNRMAPTHTGRVGLLQPIPDFLKLMAKEDIVPAAADKKLFGALPAFGLAVVATAGLLLPVCVEYAFATAKNMVKQAQEAIAPLSESHYKTTLMELADYIVTRRI